MDTVPVSVTRSILKTERKETARMSKTNKCNGCRMCVQGDFGRLVERAAHSVRMVGTLGLDQGGSMVANTSKRTCMFCGHRLEFHARLGVEP